jgi:hypothetical protein
LSPAGNYGDGATTSQRGRGSDRGQRREQYLVPGLAVTAKAAKAATPTTTAMVTSKFAGPAAAQCELTTLRRSRLR